MTTEAWVLLGLGMLITYRAPSFSNIFLDLLCLFIPFFLFIYILNKIYPHWIIQKSIEGKKDEIENVKFYKWAVGSVSFVIFIVTHTNQVVGLISFLSVFLALIASEFSSFPYSVPFFVFSLLAYLTGQPEMGVLLLLPIMKSGKLLLFILWLFAIIIYEGLGHIFDFSGVIPILHQVSVFVILLYWRYIITIGQRNTN